MFDLFCSWQLAKTMPIVINLRMLNGFTVLNLVREMQWYQCKGFDPGPIVE